MSWLRNHVRHYVVPGIRALAKVGGEKGIVSADPPAWNGRTRPSTKCDLAELGIIYATVASVLKKGDETRERALALCRGLRHEQVSDRGRARRSLTTESKAATVELEKLWGTDRNDEDWREKYGAARHDVMHAILCNAVRSLRRRVRSDRLSVVLPGRDVWAFEVMARRKRVPTIYDARVSRSVSSEEEVCRSIVSAWPVDDWRRALVFDTGFAGSIWRDICKATGERPHLLLLSASSRVNERQLFPGHTGSRQKALAFEYLPKYCTRGSTKDGAPVQHLAALKEFIDAALLTVWLWHHVSPRQVRAPKPEKKPKIKVSGGVPLDQFTATPGQGVLIDGSNWQTQGFTAKPFVTGLNVVAGNTADLSVTSQWAVSSDSAATTSFQFNDTVAGLIGPTFGPTYISDIVVGKGGKPITG